MDLMVFLDFFVLYYSFFVYCYVSDLCMFVSVPVSLFPVSFLWLFVVLFVCLFCPIQVYLLLFNFITFFPSSLLASLLFNVPY